MSKIRLLVLCGGQSEEHEVSLSSAKSVLEALPKDRFEVTPVVITREGKWLPPSETPKALERGSAPSGGEMVLAQASSAAGFDAVFPLLHGPMGEDGTIQGLLRLAGIPFVGSSVMSSAVCMDKIMMKDVLANYNIPQVQYAAVTKHEFSSTPDKVLERLENLGFPMFVKPANLGSSVGISKAKNLDELRVALRFAFGFDRRVIVEKSTDGKPRELEVAILGNDNLKASPVGELTFESEFYDYETKYTAGRAEMHIPAGVPPEISARVQTLALEAYQILDCAGLARIDFFYVPETGELFLNELNTIPGFTKTSMYPKLWEAGGLSYAELVSRLVELALEQRH
ncbi:MAG: D-alanyl-alanine synthetase [Deinococcota bacterium]|jgi:D-alanine-D-alanine ligase